MNRLDLEYLQERSEFEKLERQRNPWIRQDVISNASHLKALQSWYLGKRDEMLALVPNRFRDEGLIIWEHTNNYSDPSQRLDVFRAELIAKGWAPRESLKSIDLHFIDPARREVELEQAKEWGALTRALDSILQASSDMDAALTIYNRLRGERSWHKLDEFCRRLVEAQLLPTVWVVGARGGTMLEQLKRKLLGSSPENKMLNGSPENK